MPARSRDDDPRLGDISEGTVLRAILTRTAPASHTVLGPGDDAAVIAAPSGSVVATTDTLVHGPDFRLAWSSGYDLGWKAAAVNLADIAAMGARPTALLVALAVPRDMRLSFVQQLSDGFREACAALAPGCAVVGGDLTVSDRLMIAVTALGDLEGRGAVTRSGAREGDVVAVAGELGLAAHGLSVLFGRFRDGDKPVPIDTAVLQAGERAALSAQLRPSPPIGLGPVAAVAGATAMMDISDG
ncbi:thiamine-phosphate kinase, partial [Microbacterium sp.]|uniref:thiamine-phosphate kinase n=1 Tax=Microbacterium sp. TaxID=51671 RepID=UPI002616E92B